MIKFFPGLRDKQDEEATKKKRILMESFAMGTALSFQLVGSTLIFAGIGYFIDKRLHTKPWILLGGFFLGSILGFWRILSFIEGRIREDNKK